MNLFDLVFPLKCVICGKWEVWICEGCRKELKWARQRCPMCGLDSRVGITHEGCRKRGYIDGLWSVYEYEESMQKIVKAIKYRFCRELVGEALCELEIERIEADMVVPIPLFWHRENWRGFNQAEIVARDLAKRWGMELNLALEKIKMTKPLAELEANERKKAIKGVFRLKTEVEGKRVVLVDDVFTTGATMREAAWVLKKGGATSVWGFVLAS